MPYVIQALDVPKNDRGQVRVGSTLQVENYEHLFALGDLASFGAAHPTETNTTPNIPNTAQAAFQQATYAAWNIWASLTGHGPLSFRYSHLGEMLTLGKEEAALAGLGLTLEGPLANCARRLIYLWRFPTLEHQINVGLEWIVKPFKQAYSGMESP